MVIRSVRDLVVYNKAFEVAMAIFEISKTFPNGRKIRHLLQKLSVFASLFPLPSSFFS